MASSSSPAAAAASTHSTLSTKTTTTTTTATATGVAAANRMQSFFDCVHAHRPTHLLVMTGGEATELTTLLYVGPDGEKLQWNATTFAGEYWTRSRLADEWVAAWTTKLAAGQSHQLHAVKGVGRVGSV